jgi:ribulose-bisphosphate carboxylase large chain
MSRIRACYRVCAEAATIAGRAEALAVEQSVEMPLTAIDDATVLAEIVGRVEEIRDHGGGVFEVWLGLATATTTTEGGAEAGQLLNMLFGNSSLQEDVTLCGLELPEVLTAAFGGPRHGLAGLRRRVGAERRAMTASALKPQGLPVSALAALAGRLAEGGIDFIKDDHGLADQVYSPFAERVPACAAAVLAAGGGRTRYLPSLSGSLDRLRRQIGVVRAAGLDSVLIAPMVVGLPAFQTLVRDNPDLAFMTHPALAGTARIAPPVLLGTLFRVLGADATVFPNHGGRFGYSPETCRALAAAAREPWSGVRPTLPVPAGGMTLERVDALLEFYGPDVLILIGGNLLAAGARLVAEATALTRRVSEHGA